MPSPSSHLNMAPVVRMVQKQPERRRSGTSHLPPDTRHVSALAGDRDTSQGGSLVASTIHNQNSTPSSSLNNSAVADITQRVTSTPFAAQRQSMNTPTTTPGSGSRSTPAPGGTSQADSKLRVVSSLASSIASTPTPLSGRENLPTPISDPAARAVITNPLQTRATRKNLTQRQWQLQMQAVSTPRSMVSSSCSIHRFGHSDMTRLVFATGSLMEPDLWNRQQFMSASDF